MFEIFGAKGSIKNTSSFLEKITVFSKKNDVVIQVFDSDLIFGKKHIITSINHALRSIEQKKNTTNSIAMEIMLYTSGERQLKLAIPKMGIKNYTKKIAFIIINNKMKIANNLIEELLKFLSLKRCDLVLNCNEKYLKKFGIGEKETKTISKNNYEKLIIEKVAFVDILK